MHNLTKLVVAAAMAAAGITTTGQAASAGDDEDGRNDAPVTSTDDAYLGRVRQQVNEANRYVYNPPPCHYFDESQNGTDVSIGYDGHLDPLPADAHNGVWRYRLLREVSEDDDSGWAAGMQYVRECYATGQPVDTVEEDGWGLGWNAVIIFDALTPENIARLAIDEFFLGLEAPEPTFNPASPTLVDFETWMWVEGDDDIPTGDEEIESDIISVPGLDQPGVQAFASVREVLWEMGDGGSKSCPIATDEASAQALDCIYRYDVSSAGQPGEAYQGSATLVWQGRYTINGAPAPEVLPDILRETPFELGVEEAQALNTDD